MLDKNDIKKLTEVFATKEEMLGVGGDVQSVRGEVQGLKDDILEFKNEILTGQDEILGKLDTLLQEKTMEDAQDKRRSGVLKIHDDALRRAKILSKGEIAEINKLGSFN